MPLKTPLVLSRLFLAAADTTWYVRHRDRLPADTPLILVSNHRSVMDAFLLMLATDRVVRFACHHYMSQVPVLNQLVLQMGCFPLESRDQRRQSFFHQATELLQNRQAVGIFPEGAPPMVQVTPQNEVGAFERGFAHLAFRAPVSDLAVVPIAIAPVAETCQPIVPLKLLQLFDPSEPLFDQQGWHPLVLYQQVNVLIGKPWWITPDQRQQYQGKQARNLAQQLTDHCQKEIYSLLQSSYRPSFSSPTQSQ